MGVIVAIVNNKGGVGKTTLAVNLAHALANRGKKILIVDNDAQCNATSLLVEHDVISDSIYELYENDETAIERCIYPTVYDGLSIIPNSEETAALEISLNRGIPSTYLRLRDRIRDYAKNHFDFTFIDTPPNWGYFVLAALHTADCVIVPILCSSRFSMEGLTRALSLIDGVEQVSNEDAVTYARRLAKEEGIFAGISSGGAMAVALRIAETVDNAVIVSIVCDRGDRYLSTGVFPA